MRWDRRRLGLAGGLALALLLTAAAGVRVLGPTDTVDLANTPYPEPVSATARVYGDMMRAPLIVASRLRVYAAKNRVWADGPLNAKSSVSAYWSFRRWPAVLVGVVISGDQLGGAPGSRAGLGGAAGSRVGLVVSKWSDGRLVALDPVTGRVAWRADAEVGATEYVGRRTGASTVYAPPDLYTATVAEGRPVVVSVGRSGALVGFDGATGRQLWSRTRSGRQDCRTDFTGPGIVVVADGCARPSTVDVYDALTGAPRAWPAAVTGGAGVRPTGCVVGRSECTGMSSPDGGWLIGSDGGVTAAPALTGASAWLVGATAVSGDESGLIGYDAATGTVRWVWPPRGGGIAGTKIIAVEPGRVYVVTKYRDLITIDVATGRELSHFTAKAFPVDEKWVPGYGYASHGFVAIERLRPGATADQDDDRYYYPVPSLVFTGS